MRPYNHADNTLPNGQPKMSEDAWAISERLREGDFLDLVEALPKLGAPTPRNLHELVLRLVTMIEDANKVSDLDAVKLGKSSMSLPELANALLDDASKAQDKPFTPQAVVAWGAAPRPKTIGEAIDALRVMQAELRESLPYEPADLTRWPSSGAPTTVGAALNTLARIGTLSEGVNGANWAGLPPKTLAEALNRMAAVVKALNAGVAIP